MFRMFQNQIDCSPFANFLQRKRRLSKVCISTWYLKNIYVIIYLSNVYRKEKYKKVIILVCASFFISNGGGGVSMIFIIMGATYSCVVVDCCSIIQFKYLSNVCNDCFQLLSCRLILSVEAFHFCCHFCDIFKN